MGECVVCTSRAKGAGEGLGCPVASRQVSVAGPGRRARGVASAGVPEFRLSSGAEGGGW